jgi:hypothetical protein
MKSCLLALALFGWWLPSQAQLGRGNGQVSTVTYKVPAFTGIEVGAAFTVELIQGETPSVRVQTDANLQPVITLTVIEGVLHVASQRDLRNPTQLKVTITNDRFASIQVGGSCQLTGSAPLYGSTLALTLRDAAQTELALAYDTCVVDLSGASRLSLTGSAQRATFTVSGVGVLAAYALAAEQVTASVSGAGSAQVHAQTALMAEVSGMGNVTYQGQPAVQQQVSGMGVIRKR